MNLSPRLIGRFVARVLALLFAVIVVGVIADKVASSFGSTGVCFYGLKQSDLTGSGACQYGEGVGILTIVAAIAMLVFDVLEVMRKLESFQKHIFIADAVVSGLLAFLWFVGFLYLTVQWANTDKVAGDVEVLPFSKSAAESGIAFSFFSMVAWVALLVLAIMNIRSAGSTEVSN